MGTLKTFVLVWICVQYSKWDTNTEYVCMYIHTDGTSTLRKRKGLLKRAIRLKFDPMIKAFWIVGDH